MPFSHYEKKLSPTAPRVLLVDDDHEIRVTARILLHVNGYAVDTAGNAEDAMRIMATKNINAVVLDLMLPDASETDLFSAIRNHTPEMPIVICTGLEFSRINPEILSAPLVSYLEKPYTCSALCGAVAGILCANIEE